MIRDLPTGRDVLTQRDAPAGEQAGIAAAGERGGIIAAGERGGIIAPGRTIEVDRDDEPTADLLRRPARQRGWLSRLDARTRSILTGAAVAAVIVNAGAVWAYWRITDPAAGQAAHAGTVVEMNLRARSDLNVPLERGGVGNLTVTVTNDNNFPIRITSVSPGAGNVIANDEHREAGCAETGVSMARERVPVLWEVPRNTIGAFTIPDALRMNRGSDKACDGATFTVPVLVTGLR